MFVILEVKAVTSARVHSNPFGVGCGALEKSSARVLMSDSRAPLGKYWRSSRISIRRRAWVLRSASVCGLSMPCQPSLLVHNVFARCSASTFLLTLLVSACFELNLYAR